MPDPVDPFATPQAGATPPVTPPADPFADQLASITNADGSPKYQTIDKALEALNASQQHIANLEAEQAATAVKFRELEAERDKLGSVDDFVSRLTAAQNQDDQTPPAQPPQGTGLDEAAVLNLITQATTQKERETALKSNLDKVNLSLTQTFGDKVSDVVVQKARELGTTPEAMRELSKSQPDMVLALFNTSGVKPTGVTTNSYNVPPINPQQPELKSPEKSLLIGATSGDQAAYMKQIQDSVYRQHGIKV